jgi:hypothetical protein
MLAACQARPSLSTALRGAKARLDGEVLSLEVAADFVGFASMHLDEYRDLAKAAAGRALKVQIGVGARAEEAAAPEASPAELKRERLRREAEREPAVQEALDLFGAKVVDVREAKS